MTKLISSYVAYVQKNAEIKQRQRMEREAELEPFLTAVGHAIIEAQDNGKRIEDIEYEIGAKNRTLVYRAKRLAKGIKGPAKVETPVEPEKPAEKPWRVDKGVAPGTYNVWVNDAYAGDVFVEDEMLSVPDEWAADSENQKIYREIIAHIKEL